MFSHVLNERQETPLCVVPGIWSELSLIRLQALNHSGYAELIVTLSTVQSAEREIIYSCKDMIDNYKRCEEWMTETESLVWW